MGRKELTSEEVRQIRSEYKIVNRKAVNLVELAQRYDISQERVRNIAKGYESER